MANVMTRLGAQLMMSAALALVSNATLAQSASPASGSDPQPFVNSIGVSFVRIPAGSFLMGSANDDREASAAEKPQHRVNLTRPYYLAPHEVTQAQWESVMGRSAFEDKRSNP